MLRSFSKFALVMLFICLNQYTRANDISEFLKRKAVTVDSLEFVKSKHEFLNYQAVKGKAKWFDGSILTNENTRFNQLKVKFNILNNSLYVNFNETIYRVPNFALKEFVIIQKGETMTFRKGYSMSSSATLTATYSGSSQEILTFLNTYPEFKSLHIDEISLSENEVNELKISLKTATRSQVTQLRSFIESNDTCEISDLGYDVPRIEPNKYLQVLYENDHFVVLKYHFKRTATTETVSLVKVSDAFLIGDEDYYLAGTDKQLVEFLFTKKSLEKSLNSLNVSYDKEIQNVGSESRAVKWFEGNSFNGRGN